RTNQVNHDILSIKPNPLLCGDEPAPVEPTESELFGNYTCRDLSYELTKDGHITAGSLRACRKKRKVWYIDVPMASSNQS
ncbi:SH3 domain-containing protein, partial [Vibrio owensii]